MFTLFLLLCLPVQINLAHIMSTEIDRPLPVSNWGPTGFEQAQAQQPVLTHEQLTESWRQTFVLFGTTPEDAFMLYSDEFSQYLNRKMHTYEDIYRHLIEMRKVGIAPPEPVQAEPEPESLSLEEKRAAKQARAALIAEKNAAWRKAVADRKAAIAQWDIYVQRMHAEFIAAREV